MERTKPHKTIIEIADDSILPLLEQLRDLLFERKEIATKIRDFIKDENMGVECNPFDNIPKYIQVEEKMKRLLKFVEKDVETTKGTP